MPKKRRSRKRNHSASAFSELLAGNPAWLVYGSGEEQDAQTGIQRIRELAKDQQVFLLRLRPPTLIRANAGPLESVLRRVPSDQIALKRLVPGVTCYGTRIELPDGPALVLVTPSPLPKPHKP